MEEGQSRKLRSDDTWDEVRRAWEAGQTGASLARRYDVGLANLWRRRASDGWRRRKAPDPRPEPLEGWDRYARGKLEAFDLQLAETRVLAQKLAEAMTGGGPMPGVPLWHVGYVLAWREERLGAAVAAEDRAWMARHDWAADFWDAAGRLEPVEDLDRLTLIANRDAWREDAGLPAGVAEGWP